MPRGSLQPPPTTAIPGKAIYSMADMSLTNRDVVMEDLESRNKEFDNDMETENTATVPTADVAADQTTTAMETDNVPTAVTSSIFDFKPPIAKSSATNRRPPIQIFDHVLPTEKPRVVEPSVKDLAPTAMETDVPTAAPSSIFNFKPPIAKSPATKPRPPVRIFDDVPPTDKPRLEKPSTKRDLAATAMAVSKLFDFKPPIAKSPPTTTKPRPSSKVSDGKPRTNPPNPSMFKPPTAKPSKPPTNPTSIFDYKPPTAKLPTTASVFDFKPPTVKPPTVKPPTVKPPTTKPPTTKSSSIFDFKPPTVKTNIFDFKPPPANTSEPQPSAFQPPRPSNPLAFKPPKPSPSDNLTLKLPPPPKSLQTDGDIKFALEPVQRELLYFPPPQVCDELVKLDPNSQRSMGILRQYDVGIVYENKAKVPDYVNTVCNALGTVFQRAMQPDPSPDPTVRALQASLDKLMISTPTRCTEYAISINPVSDSEEESEALLKVEGDIHREALKRLPSKITTTGHYRYVLASLKKSRARNHEQLQTFRGVAAAMDAQLDLLKELVMDKGKRKA